MFLHSLASLTASADSTVSTIIRDLEITQEKQPTIALAAVVHQNQASR
jgi:hypothetical protein